MSPHTKLSPRHRLFYQAIAETFDQNQFADSLLDVAERLQQTEDFLIYLATKEIDIAMNHIARKSKHADQKLIRHLTIPFWLHLQTLVELPQHLIRYSERIQILLSWYRENKTEIDLILSVSEPFERYFVQATSLITSLHHDLTTEASKRKIAARHGGMQSNVKKITTYLNELNSTYSHYIILRIDLGYKSEDNTFILDEKMSEHMAHFHRARRHKPSLFKSLCGYITKFEYSYYRGYYWRTLLFFNQVEDKDLQVFLHQIGNYWNEVIVGSHGTYHMTPLPQTTMEDKIRSTFFKHNIVETARYLCEKDEIIRPNVDIVKLFRTGQISANRSPKVVLEEVSRGRKRDIDRVHLAQLHTYGLGATAIAKQLGISRSSVYKILQSQKSTAENKAE